MYVKDIRTIKTDLRNKYKKIRSEMEPQRKTAMDVEMQSRLLSLQQYARSPVILTYLSKSIEVDTYSIVEAAFANHKRVAVPRCIPGRTEMEFYFIRSLQDVEPGAFGVMEPVIEKCELLVNFSCGLCIVPGLSFDAEGYRLGYGKGYYDRFLCRFQGDTVGLCYSACTQWRLPHGRYDKPVDLIITEKYIRRTGLKNF